MTARNVLLIVGVAISLGVVGVMASRGGDSTKAQGQATPIRDRGVAPKIAHLGTARPLPVLQGSPTADTSESGETVTETSQSSENASTSGPAVSSEPSPSPTPAPSPEPTPEPVVVGGGGDG